ncbi:Uncharacterised protein [Yersinia enterocolitica]|nr:Uncharacterised protein [Yersinia enterocolitica]
MSTTWRACGVSSSRTPSPRFPRHCLGNWEMSRLPRNPRQCLGNSTSPNWPKSLLCRGRPMFGCCRSRMTMPASSTRPRRCAVAGACANSTGRLAASSTNARPCPRTRRRCWSRAPWPSPRMPSRPTTRSKTRMCWSSSTSRTSIRNLIWKRL